MTSHPNPLPNTPKDAEMQRRKLTQYCLKSLSLEGIEPDQETLVQIELLDSGKITMDEFVENMLKKANIGTNITKHKSSN